MAKKVGQIRWFGNNASQNYPNYASQDFLKRLRDGTIFPRSYPIVQLGIQSLPGTKIYINSSTNPIIIGSTGIYELNVDGLAQIISIQFDAQSLKLIEDNANAYVIVDYVYEETE